MCSQSHSACDGVCMSVVHACVPSASSHFNASLHMLQGTGMALPSLEALEQAASSTQKRSGSGSRVVDILQVGL